MSKVVSTVGSTPDLPKSDPPSRKDSSVTGDGGKRMLVHPPAAPKRTQGREMKTAEFNIPFENHSAPAEQPRSLTQTVSPLVASRGGVGTIRNGLTVPKSLDQTHAVGSNLKPTHEGRIIRYFPEWALLSNQESIQSEEEEDAGPGSPELLKSTATQPPGTPLAPNATSSTPPPPAFTVNTNDAGVPLDHLLAPDCIVGSKAADWVRVAPPEAGTLQKALKTTYKGIKAAEVKESLMDAFWDSIHAITGFRKKELELMRSNPVERDVCDPPVSAEYEFADDAVIQQLRLDLQNYLDALKKLQEQNAIRSAKTLKLKNYVEDSGYKGARETEASLRMTPATIAKRFSTLTYTTKKIKTITSDIADLAHVEEIFLTNNLIETVGFLPAAVKIASFDGNCITKVENRAVLNSPDLIFLGLSCNSIRANSLGFLRASHSLVIVDLSYNEITELMPVVDALADHPTIKEVDLSGNPVALLPKYRQVLACQTSLSVLDTVAITEAERTQLKNSAEVAESLKEAIAIHFSLDSVDGVLSLMPHSLSSEEDKNNAALAGKGGAKDAKAKAASDNKGKKGKGGTEELHANAGLVTVKKTHLMLRGTWLSQSFDVEADLLQTPGPAAEEEMAASGAGKKPAAKDAKKSKAAQEVAPQVLDHLPLKHKAVVEINPQGDDLAHLPQDLFHPMKVLCYLVDTMQNDTTNEVLLGTFHVDLSKVNGPTTSDAATASLAIHSVLIADTQQQILVQKKEIDKLVVQDRDLDKRDLEAATPVEGHTPAAPAKGGKEKGGKGGGQSKVANEELLLRQAESAQRKVEIEESQMKQQRLELDLQRFQNIHVSLKVQFNINPPPVVEETFTVTPRIEELEKGKDKKKKK